MPTSGTGILTQFSNIFNRLVSADQTAIPFNLGKVEGFPFVDWSSMQEYYADLIMWFNGDPFKETILDTKTGKTVDKFPIKLNPIPGTCQKHAAVLLGNTLESIRDGGMPIQFLPSSRTTDEAKTRIKDALESAFEYAGGGSIFADAATTSQFMGGSVWRVRFDSEDEKHPVQVEIVDPAEFFGIPVGGNHWKLHEAWLVREVNRQDAERYGYVHNSMDDRFFYIEHWTKDRVQIYVNNSNIKDEENVFGVVPFMYIPHIRIRGFLGKSIITEAVKGIVKEFNLRFADTGDAVSEDSHSVLAMRGVRNSLTETSLSDGRRVVNLGSRSGMGANETDPDLFSVNTKSVSEPMLKLIDKLEDQYRIEAFHPAVADGKDEGSQRSAATLVARMWPLISHIEVERVHMAVGLTKLAEMILHFYFTKSLWGISKEDVDTDFTIKWSSSLPRDREALVNEIAIRRKNGLISLPHSVQLFGDVVDVEHEIDLILEEEREKAEQEQAGDEEEKGDSAEYVPEPGAANNVDASNQIRNEE